MTETGKKENRFKDRAYWANTWIRFNSGDRSAFEEIYSEYIDVLFAYGSKLTNDQDLIKDSIQDLFIDLYRHKVDLRQPESFEFYFFKALKRLIFRKIGRKSKVQNFNDPDFFAFKLTFNLEEDYIHKETEKSKLIILQNLLNDLSQSNRELLFYKFNSNLTFREIGELIEMNPDAVKKQIYRIISGLRKSLNSTQSLLSVLCLIT